MKTTQTILFRLLTWCISSPIVLIVYSVIFRVAIGHMLVTTVIAIAIALIIWITLRKLFRVTSNWILIVLPGFLALVTGWWCAKRMSGASGMRSIWVNVENELGRKLTEQESGSLYSQTLASTEYWQAVHSNAVICSAGALFVTLTLLFILRPRGL